MVVNRMGWLKRKKALKVLSGIVDVLTENNVIPESSNVAQMSAIYSELRAWKNSAKEVKALAKQAGIDYVNKAQAIAELQKL